MELAINPCLDPFEGKSIRGDLLISPITRENGLSLYLFRGRNEGIS